MTIKVLVIDPTHNAEKIARDALTPLGCQIITASSTALALFLARKNFPSLVIAAHGGANDYSDLPGELKADPDLAHIPVVLVGDALDAVSTGADKCLSWAAAASNRFVAELAPYLLEAIDERPEETPE